jgi:hypothetical protein
VDVRSFLHLGSRRTPPGGETAGWAGRTLPLLAAVLLMLGFLTFPTAPPDNDVDSSSGGVLSYAHQQGIQFGPDLVFFYYPAQAADLRMAVDVALCLVTAAGLCLAAWRLRPLWRWPRFPSSLSPSQAGHWSRAIWRFAAVGGRPRGC